MTWFFIIWCGIGVSYWLWEFVTMIDIPFARPGFFELVIFTLAGPIPIVIRNL